MSTPIDQVHSLRERMQQSIIGQERIVERLLIALLCNGNVLVEGLPGLAKTRAVKSLARNLEADYNRIQFTPDLLPSDVTGTEVYHTAEGRGSFQFQPGPIFANIVLADEINRAPAKVQAALLEAMEERQVSVAGTTHPLPPLFMVMATQNPVEQEGTYPLPEAQMDRFLMHVNITYPERDDEIEVLRLVRAERRADASSDNEERTVIPQQAIFDARREIDAIGVSEVIESYIVDLINATRTPGAYSDDLGRWVRLGASPRGGIALDAASRAHAWLNRRDHVLPEDVQAVAHDCLRHRLMLGYEASAEGISADRVLDDLLKLVAVG